MQATMEIIDKKQEKKRLEQEAKALKAQVLFYFIVLKILQVSDPIHRLSLLKRKKKKKQLLRKKKRRSKQLWKRSSQRSGPRRASGAVPRQPHPSRAPISR